MGHTCASVQIAWRGDVGDVTKAVSRSYGKLGHDLVKKASPEGGKHVILCAGAGRSYVSVYDSDNAGELRDLAVAASKTWK